MSISQSQAATELSRIIRQSRRRLRWLAFFRTLSAVLLAAILCLGLALLALDWLRYDPLRVDWIRGLSYAALALLVLLLAVLPWLRRLPARRLALHLEEQAPELRQVLLSAVECLPSGRKPTNKPVDRLQNALIEQALAHCRNADFGLSAERWRIARAATAASLVGLMGLMLYYLQPALLVNGLPYLLPWRQAEAHNPYQVAVQPGDLRILQSGDQLIEAHPLGFAPSAATLWTRELDQSEQGSGQAEWRARTMAKAASGSGFELFLFDQQHSLEYYVEADNVRSPVYRLDVIEPPGVQRLELTYHYPAHTGLAPKTVVDEGDIQALPGTRIGLRAQLRASRDEHPQAGQVVLNGERTIPLDAVEDGWLSGEMIIDAPGIYRIDLALDEERHWPSTPDYRIDIQQDRAPTIRFSRPGRDIQVTNIEEPALVLTASDDFAIDRLELKLMINGGEEQTLILHEGGEQAEVSGRHVVMLEQLALQPGDLVAYYGQALDRGIYSQGQQAATDMYFLQIRPFEQEFRAAEQQGGGGGGGQDEGALSAQQRQFVVAVFKLQRDQNTLPEATIAERRETLTEVQVRIRDRVEAIVRRLGERGAVRQHEGYQQMLDELPQAAEAMEDAERALRELGPEPTLAPAQKALQHLQRAEAAFRETQVAQGGQGGGGGSQAEDLTELFQLELDKLRNQYETVQRGQAQEQQEMDELLRKLRELARRQEQELERQQRRLARAGQPSQSAGSSSENNNNSSSNSSGNSSAQQALAEAAEELARQLERLSRKQPETNQSQQQNNPANSPNQPSQASQNNRPQPRSAPTRSAQAGAGQNQPSQARPIPPSNRQAGVNTQQAQQSALNSAQQRLQDAIQQMQQAAAATGAEGVEARRQALQELQQALSALSGKDNKASSLAQDLDNAQRRAERLAAWQQQGLETVQEWNRQQSQQESESAMSAQRERPDTSSLRQRKRQMALESEALEQSLRRMIPASDDEAPELAQQLRQIVADIDRNRLSDRLRQMNRLLLRRDLQQAEQVEQYIADTLAELNADLAQAETLLQQESEQELEQALAQVQALMDDVANAQQQAANGAESQTQPQTGQAGEQQTTQAQSGQENGQQTAQASQQGGQQASSQQTNQAGGMQGGGSQQGGQVAGGQAGSRLQEPSPFSGTQGEGQIDAEFQARPPNGRFGPPGARQAGQWSRTAEQLADSLRARGIAMERIDAVLNGVRQYEQQSQQTDGQALSQYQGALLDSLRQLEFTLRQELQPERPQARLPVAPAPVAPEYRAEVEQYFRELAGEGRGALRAD